MTNHAPIVVLDISPFRRLFGCAILYSSVIISTYLGLTSGLPIMGQALMWAMAFCIYLLSERFRAATRHSLLLYSDRIQRSDGVILTRLDNLCLVERGALAFKPSNGFTLHLVAAAPAAWLPGLYWQFGRKIGVGGAFSAAQTEIMADQIALRMTPVKETELSDT